MFRHLFSQGGAACDADPCAQRSGTSCLDEDAAWRLERACLTAATPGEAGRSWRLVFGVSCVQRMYVGACRGTPRVSVKLQLGEPSAIPRDSRALVHEVRRKACLDYSSAP
jgi:hypothetical protein